MNYGPKDSVRGTGLLAASGEAVGATCALIKSDLREAEVTEVIWLANSIRTSGPGPSDHESMTPRRPGGLTHSKSTHRAAGCYGPSQALPLFTDESWS